VNEDNLSRGYVALYRSIIDNPVFTQLPAEYFKVFIFCLVRAAYKPRQYWNGHAMADLPIGAFCGNTGEIAAKTGIAPSTVRRALQALENSQMVVTKSTNKFSLYTVVNFNAYQNGSIPADNQTANNWAVNRQTSEQSTGKQVSSQPANNRRASVIREEEATLPLPAEAVAEAVAPARPKKPAAFDSDKFFDEQFWPIVWNTRDKKPARKAWNRIVKDETGAASIMEAAVKQGPFLKAEAERGNRNAQYVSSWLNKEHYKETAALLPFEEPPTRKYTDEDRARDLAEMNAQAAKQGLPPVKSF
jgi:DNA-binding transcriptional regulator of glucitol operon